MTLRPGDLVVLNTTVIAWAEVHDGIYEVPDAGSDRKVQVLRDEHGLVRGILGLAAFVFWSRSGRSGLVFQDQLTVVAHPLPDAALVAALKHNIR